MAYKGLGEELARTVLDVYGRKICIQIFQYKSRKKLNADGTYGRSKGRGCLSASSRTTRVHGCIHPLNPYGLRYFANRFTRVGKKRFHERWKKSLPFGVQRDGSLIRVQVLFLGRHLDLS